MQVPRHAAGKGGGFTPRAGAGQRSRSQGKGDGGAQAKSAGFQPWPRYSGQMGASGGKREDEGQRTAAPSEPSPADAGNGRRTTGKGDGEGQDKPTGFEPSPADAGDGKGAEGKGDGKGKGKPAGSEPSPADAGTGRSATGKGDGEGQDTPTGFKPSPAVAEKLSKWSLLWAMMITPRRWLRPTEPLAQEKKPLAFSFLRGPGAVPRARKARGSTPRGNCSLAGPMRKNVGLPVTQTFSCNPSGLRTKSIRLRGQRSCPVAGSTLAPIPPHMVAVAKPAKPLGPRTPSLPLGTLISLNGKRRSRIWMTKRLWL